MHKLSVIGHFGFGHEHLDGQTIKTKIIANELKKIYGEKDVVCHDTHGGLLFLIRMPFTILSMMMSSHSIIMLPAHNGLRCMSPIIIFLNLFFKRKVFYVVIGGWLPNMLAKRQLLRIFLKRLDGIFVETQSMHDKMTGMGFKNVVVMPNCKRLDILNPSEFMTFPDKPYPLCTFSRVIKEKGIEDAINAVKECNKILGYTAFTLDIYGQIGKDQKHWFDNLMQQHECVKYQGYVEFSNSVNILKKYFALLFPTYYSGECFAGTVIDAFAAGIPVIASDWHDNRTIIKDNHTGIIFPVRSVKDLTDILLQVNTDPSIIYNMRINCVKEAQKYQPNIVIQTLLSAIENTIQNH